jgi:hypothetical protein
MIKLGILITHNFFLIIYFLEKEPHDETITNVFGTEDTPNIKV